MAYLELRRGTYHGLHSVPPKAQPFIGKRRFCRSLQTDSLAEAKRRLIPWEKHWRKLIAEASSDNPDRLVREYETWRQAFNSAVSEDERQFAEHLLADELDGRIAKAANRRGLSMDDTESVEAMPEYRDAVDGYKYATGQKVRFDEYLESYLALGGRAQKTEYQIRRLVQRLAERLPYVDDVTALAVQREIERRIRAGNKPSTIKRDLSMFRRYWTYLQRNEHAPDGQTPFDDRYIPNTHQGQDDRRRPFSAEESVRLLNAAIAKGSDQTLVDLIRLGMWTGARRGELCKLRVDDVQGQFLWIGQSKTKAGIRGVPIHPRLRPTIDRLCADSTDGYLLPELLVTPNGDRGDAVGKRFSTLKQRERFGPNYVFHSFRHTVVTLMENAGVYPWVAADIVGHEKGNFTYDRYSGGNAEDPRMRAIKCIDYPDYPTEDRR